MSLFGDAMRQEYENPSKDTVFVVSRCLTSMNPTYKYGPAGFITSNVYKTYAEALDRLWGFVCHEGDKIHHISRIDDVLSAGELVDINIDDLMVFDKNIRTIEFTTKLGMVGSVSIVAEKLSNV